MKSSKITAQFKSDIANVWKIVTNNESYAWRSDLSTIKIQDKSNFIEYTKKGFPTFFTITRKEEHSVYCFEFENKHMLGTWQGKFFASDDGMTCIEFIEEIAFKNPILSLIGMFMNIKKVQKKYIQDLQAYLAIV